MWEQSKSLKHQKWNKSYYDKNMQFYLMSKRLLILLTLSNIFGNTSVKADFYWSSSYSRDKTFPSYAAACEDRRAVVEDAFWKSSLCQGCNVKTILAPRSDGACMGASNPDSSGPIYYYCGGPWTTVSDPSRYPYPYVSNYGSCESVERFGNGCTPPKNLNTATGNCELPSDNAKNPPDGGCGNSTPNPINIISGNKHFNLTDYETNGASPLKFVRHYNSASTYYYQTLFGSAGITRNPMGLYWYHNYYQGLTVAGTQVRVTRNNGQTFVFNLVSGAWKSNADVNYRLAEIVDVNGIRTGWQVTTPSNDIETYNTVGDLLSVKDRNDVVQTLTYSDGSTPNTIAPYTGLLLNVTDSFGRSLNFTYNGAGLLATMADPVGNITSYGYDTTNNLTTVTYPDTTKKTYIYGELVNTANVSQPNALTGIIDENNVRYATYQYDTNGKAISTKHASNVEKYGLNFAADANSTSVTDPLGSIRTTHFTTVLGIVKSTGTDQPGGSGCAAASSNITYDANGNVASRSDFNGNKTCYAYDLNRNIETVRIEGLPAGTACPTNLDTANATEPARKITTAWHSSYRLPEKIAEPKKLTLYGYDAAGNLQTQTEQATTDLTGVAGLGPTPQGTARIWTYTYDPYGHVLTTDGPRTDVSDKTTYTYYPITDAVVGNRGNLKTVANALGQTTTFSNYDANGRAKTITAPNGVITSLIYTPRGKLKTLTVTGGNNVEITQYSYTPTNLLYTVTASDGSLLTYNYDAAQRLTSITDSLGNKVTYTPDNAGNSKKEAWTDSTGKLRRNTDRIYDALNRLQTIIGAAR